MADVISSISSLTGIITTTAATDEVNKCSYQNLARYLDYVKKWLEHEMGKDPNFENNSALPGLNDLLQKCAHDLEKFNKSGRFKRFLRSNAPNQIFVMQHEELKYWVELIKTESTKKGDSSVSKVAVSQPEYNSQPQNTTPVSQPEYYSQPQNTTPVSKPEYNSQPQNTTPVSQPWNYYQPQNTSTFRATIPVS
ncbi:hypothetical protein BGX27_003812, partial [Mortierella sp. AM989]